MLMSFGLALAGCVEQTHVLSQNRTPYDIRWGSQPQPMPANPPAPGGGAAGTPDDGGLPGDDVNIIGVRKFISQEPWLSFNKEGVRQAEGLKATVYLESGTSGKGAFGDGILRVVLYSVHRDPQTGEETLRREYRWDLTPRQSVPWRAKQQSVQGWGYGLRLNWGNAEVRGREIELVFQFIRRDGNIVTGEPQRLRVPERNVRIVNRIDPDSLGATGTTQPPPDEAKYNAPSP